MDKIDGMELCIKLYSKIKEQTTFSDQNELEKKYIAGVELLHERKYIDDDVLNGSIAAFAPLTHKNKMQKLINDAFEKGRKEGQKLSEKIDKETEKELQAIVDDIIKKKPLPIFRNSDPCSRSYSSHC